jgi:hypothetical protein
MRLDQLLALVVDVFLGAESQVVEDQDLARLNLGDFLDGMGAYDIFHELDLLGTVLRQEVCVGF